MAYTRVCVCLFIVYTSFLFLDYYKSEKKKVEGKEKGAIAAFFIRLCVAYFFLYSVAFSFLFLSLFPPPLSLSHMCLE